MDIEDEESKLPQRLPNGQFPKGVRQADLYADTIGRDAAGRFINKKSVGDETMRDINECFKEVTPVLFKQLMKVITASDTPPSTRVQAINIALQRAFGKPAVAVHAPSDDLYDGLDVSKLSDEAKREIITITLKENDGEKGAD